MEGNAIEISKPFEEPGFEECCSVRGGTILAVLKLMGEKWDAEFQDSDGDIL
jgi:hypothetical protein